MKRKFTLIFSILLFLAVIVLGALYVATHNVAVMNPQGMIGLKEREVFIVASLLMLIVIIPVLFLTLCIAWRYREGNKKAKYTPEWEHNHLAECIWWGVPLIIIAVLGVITWKTSHELNPFRPIESDRKPKTIQVVALQWKWLFIYPEERIATVNYFQFPEQTPINFEITADAPMNSFWIPQLGGQIYAMPAMRTELHLIADKPGRFRGSSANISGEGFAGMKFTAESSTEEDYEKWVESVKQSPEQLNLETYNQLVEPSSYNPVALYRLEQDDLFDLIIEKYRKPPEK